MGDQVKEEVRLSPKERKDLEEYLTSPQECIQQEINLEDEGQENPNLQQTLPIIDIFLNPNRSKELEELLTSSQEGEVSQDLDEDELARAYPNLFRLLWKSTLPCYPSNSM